MSKLVQITSSSGFHTLLKQNTYVIVDFYADCMSGLLTPDVCFRDNTFIMISMFCRLASCIASYPASIDGHECLSYCLLCH